jgi:branched-chain amino acid transport system permease protein
MVGISRKELGYGAALAAALIAPHLLYPVFLMKILCFSLFACAFNLLLGFGGLLSFGHAAFFGGAGYVAGYCLKVTGLPVELALAAGTAVSALLGLVMGSLAIRRQGIYFTMITLALAQMISFLCLQSPVTGGEDGLQGVPRGYLGGMMDLSNDMVMYYFVLAIAAAGFALIVRCVHSPFGEVLAAIKENEARAMSLGYEVKRYKLLAFVLSAALSGLAGAAKTVVLGFETLTDVHWSMSGVVVLMTLVGGMGTLVGPVVGAVVIISLENKLGDLGGALLRLTGIEWFGSLGESVTIVLGLAFVACVLGFRRGLVGELGTFLQAANAEERGGEDAGALIRRGEETVKPGAAGGI